MLPFEFVVDGPPVSQQTRRRARLPPWRADVLAAATIRWPSGDAPAEEPVSVEITHFYEGAPGDVDNIIKPILDAIKGLVLADDSLVTDVVCRRRPLAGPFMADPVSPVLADGLAGNREFLHVRVALSPAGGELRFL